MKAAGQKTSAPSLTLVALVAAGCSVRGAPSYTLFGAFFPAWIFCTAIGIVGAIGTRIAFVATGLAAILPYQLVVCASVGLSIALLAWLLLFGQ